MAICNLPLEIRQDIFERAITSPITPTNPSESQHGRHDYTKNAFDGGGIWQLPPRNPALSLILVNKQFSSEVKDVVNRLPDNYHVDIMFLKDHGLWTTWTLPKKPTTQYIDTVTATVRIFDPTDDLDPRFGKSLNFRGGDGGPETAVWAFHNLLVFLVEKGPGYLGYLKDCCYIVKRIEINVVAPTDGATHKSIVCTDQGQPRWLRRRRAVFNDDTIPPEKRLADYMVDNLRIVLRPDRQLKRYNEALYENIIEAIVFRVNGEELKIFDMEKMMDAYDIHNWGAFNEYAEQQKENLRKWKKWVLARRARVKQGLELQEQYSDFY